MVLSSAAGFNRESQHAVIAVVTNATEKPWPLDVQISDLDSAEPNIPARYVLNYSLSTKD